MRGQPVFHNVEGTLWTVEALAAEADIDHSTLRSRLKRYEAGKISADELFRPVKKRKLRAIKKKPQQAAPEKHFAWLDRNSKGFMAANFGRSHASGNHSCI